MYIYLRSPQTITTNSIHLLLEVLDILGHLGGMAADSTLGLLGVKERAEVLGANPLQVGQGHLGDLLDQLPVQHVPGNQWITVISF